MTYIVLDPAYTCSRAVPTISLTGGGAAVGVDDADLVVHQLDLGELRVVGEERLADGGVERVHRAVAEPG